MSFTASCPKTLSIANLLISTDCPPSAWNADGYSPVHIACLVENEQAIAFMRSINADKKYKFFDFDQKDIVNGNTPLHIAAELGNFKLILELR